MKKYIVTLTAEERQALSDLIAAGKAAARSWPTPASCSRPTPPKEDPPGPTPDRRGRRGQRRHHRAGPPAVRRAGAGGRPGPQDAGPPQPGAGPDGRAEAELIALACSSPPDGRKAWTMRLLADKLVELEVVPAGLRRARRRPLREATVTFRRGCLSASTHVLRLRFFSWRTAMGTSKHRPLSPDLERGRCRFQAWRSRRKPQSRIPQPLWAMAARLARIHGLSRTAAVLRLDYYTSERRRIEADAAQARPGGTAFVELVPPAFISKQCHVELDNGSGAVMRLQLAGTRRPISRRWLAASGIIADAPDQLVTQQCCTASARSCISRE